jgi:hypothetical protein
MPVSSLPNLMRVTLDEKAWQRTLQPADSATVVDFWRVRFALANVLAFRKTLCGGIGGQVLAVRADLLFTFRIFPNDCLNKGQILLPLQQ